MTVIELWWDVDVGICLGLLNPGLRGSSPVPCFILGHVLCGVGLLKMGLLKLLMALAFCSAEGYGVRQILIDTLNQVCLTLSTMRPNLPKSFRYDMASSRYWILCHPLFLVSSKAFSWGRRCCRSKMTFQGASPEPFALWILRLANCPSRCMGWIQAVS